MKTFQTQFRECSEAGLTNGVIKKKITPGMLPLCPEKAKKMRAAIKKLKIDRISFVRCGRFAGQCSSSHIQCRELRNVSA